MQFNREKYISGDYDITSLDEVVCASKASSLKGLDWNLFIKDYVIKELRKDFLEIKDFNLIKELMTFVPLLQLGMFSTLTHILENTNFENPTLENLRVRWVKILPEANDIKSEG